MWDDNPLFECWTALTYLAAKYPQFRVGSMVLSQSYRNPALTAKMAATLQALSGGRLILGLGAGWAEREYRAYHYPFPTAGIRVGQLEEAVIVIKRLWYDAGPVWYDGEYYQLEGAYCEPRPTPPPPLMIGGSGTQLLRVTAQHADWWNFTDPTLEGYAARLGVLQRHLAAVGRSPASVRLTWMPHVALGRTADAAQAHAPHLDPATHLIGTPAQVARRIQPFFDLGVETIMFELHGHTDPTVLKLLVNDLLPRLK